MQKKIGIVYSTVDGQTRKICLYLKEILDKDNRVELFNIDDFKRDVTSFDILLIGASIRYGHHNPKVIEFINKNEANFKKIKTAFFSVNLVARKPEKCAPDTNPYVVKFFKSITWKPDLSAVFGGMLDYKKYGLFDSLMIKLIMLITKGPTSSDEPIEYTNWGKVKEFGQALNKM